MATAITDQAAAQSAVDALTQVIALLDQAGAYLPQIKQLTRAAASDADCALMVATNELKLAERAETYERLGAATSNALTPKQQEALGRPCVCYPNCAAEG